MKWLNLIEVIKFNKIWRSFDIFEIYLIVIVIKDKEVEKFGVFK